MQLALDRGFPLVTTGFPQTVDFRWGFFEPYVP